MFERFTERARQVVVLAQAEARKRNQEVTPAHLLAGVVLEDKGLGARALRQCGFTSKEAMERLLKLPVRENPKDDISDGTKAALELALREALSLGHNYIGTEHVLLGLLRSPEIQTVLGVPTTPEEVRSEVMHQLRGTKRITPEKVQLPVQVGGSKVTADRMSGPPSKMYPVLRDLCDSEAEIEIEVDTEKTRYRGKLKKSKEHAKLWIESKPAGALPLEYSKIIAFRVLKIEVDRLPAKL